MHKAEETAAKFRERAPPSVVKKGHAKCQAQLSGKGRKYALKGETALAVFIALLFSAFALVCLYKHRHVLKNVAEISQPEMIPIETLLPELYKGLMSMHEERIKKRSEEGIIKTHTPSIDRVFDIVPL